jgi:hypothetical protein
MLTDLSFLERGKKWPPESEVKRLKTYHDNRLLFENEHGTVYKESLKRIERVIGNFSSVISFATILNFQRIMTLKIADLIFGEPPSITIADTLKRGAKPDARQKVIDKILVDTELLNKAYMAEIDVSRYGDTLFIPCKIGEKLEVDVTPPALWFPVVDKANMKRIQYHVLAYQYLEDERKKNYALKVQIHSVAEPGQCEEHIYALVGATDAFSIGGEITKKASAETAQVSTDIPVCPVFRVSNVLTSDRVFGIDDYDIIDSIIAELTVRVGQISKILDVFANPSMSGPESALEQDPLTKAWKLRIGDYYPRRTKDDAVPEYIVWDASLEANFKQIELLINQLYTLSEMGSAIFGDSSNKTGQVSSGTALRRLMMSPLAKAKRTANHFDPVLKQLISVLAGMIGTDIQPEELSITWNDGLPDDETEAAAIMSVRTGGKPTISQYSAVKRLDNLSEEDTDSELAQIQEETAAAAPITLQSIDQNDETTKGTGQAGDK